MKVYGFSIYCDFGEAGFFFDSKEKMEEGKRIVEGKGIKVIETSEFELNPDLAANEVVSTITAGASHGAGVLSVDSVVVRNVY